MNPTPPKGKPGQPRPASSRLMDSRPPLRDFTKAVLAQKQNPRNGLLSCQGPVDRGFAAVCFGASPVASALNPREERDPPADRSYLNTHLSLLLSKQDISTLQRIGHFYFALTYRVGQMTHHAGHFVNRKFNPEDTDALDRWGKRRANYFAIDNGSCRRGNIIRRPCHRSSENPVF